MNAEKYYRGTYALCRACGCHPCACGESAPPAAARVVSIARPPAGNAIDFRIWDTFIPLHELTIVESGVLLFLCRRTHGYGHHAGDVVSLAEIASAVRVSRRSAMRALARLDACRLIERTRRHVRGARAYASTHIRVTLDGW